MSHSIPRRQVVAGLAALGLVGGARGAAAAAASASPTRGLADKLAAYADALRYGDIDEATIEAAKTRLIDTLGCGIAAFDERPVRVCRDIALLPGGGGVSTVIGTDRRTTPDLAAFANGAAFRYHDFNDVYVGRQTGHPSDSISAVSRGRGGRTGERAGTHHRDRAGL